MPTYRIHGLVLSAELALPGLIAARDDAPVDVHCTFRPAPAPTPDGARRAVGGDAPGEASLVAVFAQPSGDWRVRYADGTTFDVRGDACGIDAYTPAGATLADTLTYLYGPVLALALRIRGVLALHASAVLVDDGAVVVAGANGAGKSTLAAACARAGLPVLSDDVVALREWDGRWMAHASHDHVRLWPSAADALFGADALPRLTPSWDKRFLSLASDGEMPNQAAAPVRAVLMLGPRDETADAPRVEAVAAREALLELAAHAAAARLMTAELRAMELAPLGRLVMAHPPRRLVLPDRVECLPAVVAALGALTEPVP